MKSRFFLLPLLFTSFLFTSFWFATAAEGEGDDRLMESFAKDARAQELDRVPATYRALLQVETAIAKQRLKKSLQDPISFSEEEITAKYESIKDTYTRKRRRRIFHLYKRYPTGADDIARAAVRLEIERLREEAEQGADFEELAREHSDSQTRLRGGLLGNVQEGHFAPALDEVLRSLGAGDLSPILEVEDGLTFFYCKEVFPAVVRSREEMIEISENLLLSQARKQVWYDFEQKVLRDALPTLPLSPFSAVPNMHPYLVDHIFRSRAAERGLMDAAALAESARKTTALLAAKAIAAEVERRLVRPSEAEIRAEYERNSQSFRRPVHYRLAYLQLPLDPDDSRASYRAGVEWIERFRAGSANFAAAAEQAGWISEHALVSRFGIEATRAVRMLDLGERSGLVESEGALWIFELQEKEASRRMTFEEARRRAENQIGARLVTRLQREVLEERREQLELSR